MSIEITKFIHYAKSYNIMKKKSIISLSIKIITEDQQLFYGTTLGLKQILHDYMIYTV